MATKYYEGIGRRKQATARVRLMNGSGEHIVNGKGFEEYFTRLGDLESIISVFEVTGQQSDQYDVSALVEGGGVTGQAEAVRLGLARAFLEINPDYRKALKNEDLLTRDSRVKERKKPGLKRARKAPTYTKR